MLFIYLAFCLALSFLPIEAYLHRLVQPANPRLQKGAILVWQPWLETGINSFFLFKGLLICLAGRLLFAEIPLFIFCGFLCALLSEAFSPLKKNHRTLALGLGFLTGYQFWAIAVYAVIFLILLSFIHYRIPSLIAAAGLYPLSVVYLGDPYHLASTLIFFILLCIQYIPGLQDYFNGRAKNILSELKRQ